MEVSLAFEYTTEGYKLAKAWLIDIGREDILTGGFSTDGWSVTSSANTIWNNRNAKGKSLDEQVALHEKNEHEYLAKN